MIDVDRDGDRRMVDRFTEMDRVTHGDQARAVSAIDGVQRLEGQRHIRLRGVRRDFRNDFRNPLQALRHTVRGCDHAAYANRETGCFQAGRHVNRRVKIIENSLPGRWRERTDQKW